VVALIHYGAQQPLLPLAALEPAFTPSIALPTASLSAYATVSASGRESSTQFFQSLDNVISTLTSPLQKDSLPKCPSYFNISSISDYISAWTALAWHAITFGVFSASESDRAGHTSRFWPEKINRHPLARNQTSKLFQSDDDPSLREIPQYILDYAPYCWLYSEEEYWPGLMEEHLEHTTPFIDYDPVPKEYQNPDLHNLDRLNEIGGRNIYLTSKDDPDSYPYWIGGQDNIPQGSKSKAPIILIVVDKGSYVDAFWFFFYSFNLGNQVLGVRFGNHVADWEHTMIRFRKGKPTEVFFSEHEWGAGYKWEDTEKKGNRVRDFGKLYPHLVSS
jgi:hypothetical protein